LFSELTWPILATTFNLFSVSVDSLESRGALDFEALPNDSRPVVMFKALVWMSLLLQARAGGLPLFVDVAQKAGITLMNVDGVAGRKPTLLESVGNGAGFLDYDNDGDEDLLIANGSTWETFKNGGDLMAVLYRNDAGKFTDVTRQAGLDRRGWGMGVCVADYDNDGYRDFYVTAYGSSALYKNNRNGTFREVSETAGVRDTRWSTGCSFGDYDRDGNLDLYVANYLKLDAPDNRTNAPGCQTQYMGLNVFCGPIGLQGEPDALYRNNGDGTFSDVTKAAGIKDPDTTDLPPSSAIWITTDGRTSTLPMIPCRTCCSTTTKTERFLRWGCCREQRWEGTERRRRVWALRLGITTGTASRTSS
jgi:hypothetical protein